MSDIEHKLFNEKLFNQRLKNIEVVQSGVSNCLERIADTNNPAERIKHLRTAESMIDLFKRITRS